MSSVQLLDKTRKIGKLLHNNNSGKVVFNDICSVLREILASNVLVISRKGEILGAVESAVCRLIRTEREERARLLREDRAGIADVVLRSLGILTNCVRLTMREFMRYMANVKLGVALGLLSGSLEELDGLIMNVRPANIDQLNGGPPEEGGYDIFRAAYVGDVLRRMELITEEGRGRLLHPPQG